MRVENREVRDRQGLILLCLIPSGMFSIFFGSWNWATANLKIRQNGQRTFWNLKTACRTREPQKWILATTWPFPIVFFLSRNFQETIFDEQWILKTHLENILHQRGPYRPTNKQQEWMTTMVWMTKCTCIYENLNKINFYM